MTYELRDLNGKVVIITGATSGIGAAAARALVEKGCKVLAIKGEKAQSELEEAQKELNLLKNTTASIKTCGLALDLSVTVVEISKE